ncbi:M23 family metallopeptidase [Streptomyces niveiscabiei]|uniref:Peptidoglycan DD-metalloendopeptidase family protein n=1 Tax=Streptomyces niveiscabiei TaxID=164115 RepID=A0ABW9HT82_9ACTN
MPARGKHRRPKPPRFSRSLAVAGTGGAALALPLIGAAGAHAQTASSAGASTAASVAPVSGKTVQAVPVARTASATTPAATRKTATYTVRSGDYLSKIAEEQNVRGGWQRLYEDNRDAVGSDPSLIHPGLRLSLGAKAARAESSSGSSSSSSSSASSSRSSSNDRQSARSSQSSQGSSDSKASSKGSSSQGSSKATTESASSSSGFSLPVRGAVVGTGYRVSGSMWSSGYHTGVDFVVPSGTTLRAVGAGTVVAAGWGGAYGNQVVIKLADGYYAQYAHLSALNVSVGQTVSVGQQIGYSGATGNVTGAHLHFEIRTTPDYGSDIDPLAYLRSHGVSV